MDKPNVCKQCGQEYFHRPVGVMTISVGGGNTHGFCSEGCMRAYEAEQKRRRLESEKKKGAKMVRKWQKQREQLGERIAKLQSALSSDDPSAIARARGAGILGLMKNVWLFFEITCFLIGLSVFIVIVTHKNGDNFYFNIGNGDAIQMTIIRENAMGTESEAATESNTNSIDELPSLEENTSTNTVSTTSKDVNGESTEVE